MKNKISFIPQIFKRVYYFVIIVCWLLLTVTVKAQLPTAQQIASQMKIGYNLGNTLEAICGEDAWGAGHTSQQLIDSIKAAGFNTIRIPIAWYCHSDTLINKIDSAWISRVKEVVDYCIKDSLYTIINIHWDQGWLDHHINVADSATVISRQRAYWTQIAEYFKDYDEHLLFASANEPPAKDSTGLSILLSYHQTFINAVRATGGNNSSRTLIVQGPATDIDLTYKLMNTMPTDKITDRLMAEVHYYTPYQFCLMEKDADWGNVFYYWGKNNHSTTDATRNANWGEESDIEKYFGMMKTKFVDKGIPVIIGEYGAIKRKLSLPSDQVLHDASVEYYYRYVVKSATSKGIIPFLWDTPGGLFNRSTGAINDRDVLNAIMQGANDTSATEISLIKDYNIRVFPDPFNPRYTLNVDDPFEIIHTSAYDLMGRQIETFGHSAIKSSMAIGASFNPNIYILQFYDKERLKLSKVLNNNILLSCNCQYKI
jgi:endoglucanase